MEDAVKSVWNEFRTELLYYIRTKVNDEYDAEDILQEVFLKIQKNVDRLADLSFLKAWLYRVTNNTIIDYYRKNDVLVPLDDFMEQPVERETENMNDEISTCLKALLSGLPDQDREPLELYILYNSKHREIAEKLGLSVSGSKSRVQRAKNKLRKLLSSCCELEFDRRGNIVEYRRKQQNCKC